MHDRFGAFAKSLLSSLFQREGPSACVLRRFPPLEKGGEGGIFLCAIHFVKAQ